MTIKTFVRIMLTLMLVVAYGWGTRHFSVLETPQATQQQTTRPSSEHAASLSKPVYVSPAGLRFGDDPSPRFADRIEHIMAHTQMDKHDKKHSVFVVKERQALLDLLDEAWKLRGVPQLQEGKKPRDAYDVDMGRVIGTKGQTYVRIITEAGTADIVTAYPIFERETPSTWSY